MRNYFILNGVDSRDYGVYISGQGTFSAPQKAYTFYNIPGRNGALLGNDHRLENIEVTYQAFIYSDFDNNIAEFRTFLLSLDGYHTLTDSYHLDEYRMAVYTGPFEPEITQKNDAGSFEITFSCKPQRYLFSGDARYSWVSGDNEDISGLDLYVYVPRISDTKLQWVYNTHARNRDDPTGLLSTRSCDLIVNNASVKHITFNAMTYGRVDFVYGRVTSWGKVISVASSGWATGGYNYTYKIAVSNCDGIFLSNLYNVIPYGSIQNYQSGIAFNSGYIYVRDLRFSTVGTLESYLATHPLYVDISLSTQEQESFTPFFPDLSSFDRFVNITTNPHSGTLTMKYLPSQSMANPTAFASAPLIRAYGTGSFVMDGVTVTISSSSSYVDIDCEMMDCYEGSTNRNNNVTFSTYDFPLLRPGDNSINIVSGITTLEITPRWWRV